MTGRKGKKVQYGVKRKRGMENKLHKILERGSPEGEKVKIIWYRKAVDCQRAKGSASGVGDRNS
jgi:hypothetical protein